MQYINPQLDTAALRMAMRRDGRVLIKDFFDPSVAQALGRALGAIDWTLTFRDPTGDRRLTGEELRRLQPADRMRLTQAIHALAEREFQFSFFTHALVESAEAGHTDLLTRFLRWMADEPFLSLMRDLSGIADINRVYAQATMYSRGNFLVAHDDEVSAERRRIAYVINLTPAWRPDWGGLLHFSDEAGNVVDTFCPHFNSLSLFTVPQTHFVSYVTPFAKAERCAITGWLIAA
jgi:Rps23 Pro-64 3,4-dihydroxylase Tpa1-like proline 4-hydroxylase